MSCQEIPLNQGIRFPKPSFTTVCGFSGPEAMRKLVACIHDGYSTLQVAARDPSIADFEWIRDWRVIDPNGMHLLPYPLYSNQKESDALTVSLRPLLPLGRKETPDGTNLFGSGMEECNVTNARTFARKYNLPYLPMRSSIEGGNCFVLDDGENRKAIVGFISLLLTIIGLERQNYFTDNQDDLDAIAATIQSPSDHALCAARNLALQNAYLEEENNFKNRQEAQRAQNVPITPQLAKELLAEVTRLRNNASDLENIFSTPPTDLDRIQYAHAARLFQAKLEMASQVVANDLRVNIKKIVFIPHDDLHIDLSMFPAPDGRTVYVDEAFAELSVLQSLKDIDCTGIPIRGDFISCGEQINFMNGIFVVKPSGESLFITNGTKSNKSMEKGFRRALEDNQAPFKVAFLDSMQEAISLGGGLHCLTWECLKCKSIADVVFSYLTDEPISRQRIQQHTFEFFAPLYHALE